MEADVIERFDSQLESIEGTPVMEDISSVYVLKESIPDILSLNDLSEQIKSKQEERYQKEDVISGLEKDRNDLANEIWAINDDKHIKEVSFKLESLKALDNTIKEKKQELDEIFGTLRTLEDNYKALDEKTRSMVEKMTIDYNAKAKEFSECVISCIEKPNSTEYSEAKGLADDLSNYVKYDSYEDILETSNEKEEKEVEEEKQVSEEEKSEEEKKEETELSEVKVDSLPEEEKAPEEIVSEETKTEAPVETSVEVPAKEEKDNEAPAVDMPSFTDLVKAAEQEQNASAPVETPAEVTPINPAPVENNVPTENAETKEKTPAITLLTGDYDNIASSTVKGAKATKETFERAKTAIDDKTLALAA